jgi:hypothetical protein
MNCKEFAMMAGDLAGEKLIEASKYKLALAHKMTCAQCAARLANERSLTKALQVTASAETEQASAHTKAALLKAFAEQALPSPAPRTLSTEAGPLARESQPPARVVHLFAGRKQTRSLSRWAWVAAAAVLIAVLGLAAVSFLKSPKVQPVQEAKDDQPSTIEPQKHSSTEKENSPAPQNQEQKQQVVNQAAPRLPHKNAPRTLQVADNRSRATENPRANEITTDYIPLSYVPKGTAIESGHVVRMMVARSTLISMGLPMNVDRNKEMVKADVVVGDDGLARAIRFVYSDGR